MRKNYLNYNWLYKENYEEKDLTVGELNGFKEVQLPHTNKETPLNNFDSTISNFVSIYKKLITIEDASLRHVLVFEGVGHQANVYVNGEFSYASHCGYTQFKVELTNLHEGENEIAVVVDSTELDQPPFGFVIDYLCFGGIYRDVYLDTFTSASIENYYFHHDNEKYYIDYETKGEYSTILAEITDGKDTFTITKNKGEKLEASMPKVTLWHVDHPYLYTLKLSLMDASGKVIDTVEDKIGFRYIEFKENGFFLNGEHFKIRGLNRHQSYPYVGYAMPKSAQIEDAKMIKETLCANAVRTSHYPQSPDFLKACDELGLLVFEEIPGWQNVGNLEWQKKAIQNVHDMIVRDRNHPSIILWGVRINESGDYHDFYTETNRVAHACDPYRMTGGVRCSLHSELLEDVYTYNDFINTNKGRELREKEEVTTSNKPYLVSEYGGHMMPTKSFDSEIRRTDIALVHTGVLRQSLKNDKISGTFAWCYADYNTHRDFGSGDLICYHGICDIFRNPKYSAYPYMTFQKKPYLNVTSNFNIGEHDGGYIRYFEVCSNCDKVEIYHNGDCVSVYNQLTGPLAGCFKVEDLLGDLLVQKEGKTVEESNYLKEIVTLLLAYDGIKDRKAIVEKYPTKDIDEAWMYYGKYVAGWGAHPTPYEFVGYQNGVEVARIIRGPQSLDHMEITASRTTLTTKQSYDTTRVTIEAIGTLGVRVDYANDAFVIETSENLEVIGDDVISLIGGVRSFWVKSKALEGEGYIRILSKRFGTKEIKISLVNE